ncbi:hypothetical protein [Nonomuraea dietziae]|uniref:hypothetical protein n=1 Tax=Nonomuraea dietziae TaxID=65515 RepID=UPI00341BDDE0
MSKVEIYAAIRRDSRIEGWEPGRWRVSTACTAVLFEMLWRKEQLTYRGFLAELLMAECEDRLRRRSERRIKAAGFPARSG